MKIHRAYEFRLYPNKEQEMLIHKMYYIGVRELKCSKCDLE